MNATSYPPSRTRRLTRALLAGLALSAAAAASSFGAFVVDSLDGDVTQNEIDNFIATVRTLPAPVTNHGNLMSIHGTAVQGIRRMYEITRERALLDEYIRFSDAMLSKRNDLPGGEGRVMWEGTVAPVWPNIPPDGGAGAAYAGCESGQVAGNIAYCAYLILDTPAIWNDVVPGGDPHGYGATYKERALKYLAEVDYVNNEYIRRWFVNPTTLRLQKPPDSRWASNAGNQSVTAWNRQYLFIQGFLQSARCHDLLQDEPEYLATYKEIVNQFATWFVSTATYYEFGGYTVAKWFYEIPPDGHIENMGHAQHDVVGVYECLESGYTTLTDSQVKVFADTARHIINLGAVGLWADNVDGTGSIFSSLKSDFIFLSQWNRPLYRMTAQSNIAANQLNNAEGCKNTAYILWMKRWMLEHPETTPPPTPTNLASAVSNGQVTLAWDSPETASYTIKRATTPGGPYTTVATGVDLLVHTDIGLENGVTYYYVVSAVNGAGESANSAEIAATPQPLEYVLASVANGGAASASAQRPNENANNAFDGLTTTKWFTGSGPTSGWLQYDFGDGVAWAVTRYELSSANDASGRDPKNWQLLGSDDGATWAVLDTQTNQSFPSRFHTKSYDITNTTPYRYHRLNITSNTSSTGIQLSELALIAKVSTPPLPPADLVAGGSDGQVSLSWSAATGAISYRVKRASALEGPYVQIGAMTGPEFTDSSVLNSQTYYYVVSTLNSVAESAATSPVSATPLVHQELGGEIIGTPGSFNNSPTFTKDKAFDDNFSTFFAASVDNGAWVGLDLGEGSSFVLREVRFAARSGFSSRMTGGVFQGANSPDFSDAVTFYTIPAPPPAGVMTARPFNNTTPYRYVRYASADGGQGNVAELEFWGVAAAAPEITSETDAGTYGAPYAYAILATNQPGSFTASGLPAGLALDPIDGVISGTPTVTGAFTVELTATNLFGTGAGTLSLHIAKAPSAIALDGLWQRYDGTPRLVTAATIPAGLTVNITYAGAGAAPVYPGQYAVVATVDDPNYAGAVADTLTISITALVRHAPVLNGLVDGSVQVLSPEHVVLNGQAAVSGDLLVPGTPLLRLNGQPVFGGVIDGPGAAAPTSHTVTLNGQAALRHLVRRIDAIDLPVVAPPSPPAGTRNVALNHAGQPIGDFATLRNLTLNGAVGAIAIPPGAYGTFIANGNNAFVLGVPGAEEPALYHLQGLTLNGASTLQLAGPVILTLANGVTINGRTVGAADEPAWLTLRIAQGGLTLNGEVQFHGDVEAPHGAVTINGRSTLHGAVSADRLVINGQSLLAEPTP